ncbi:MAG: hypothetical protein FWG67_09025, partial [Defluviitaleaceae bacterium]|nr:hypothetical protein [Defluviitaleaceae bacterium]
MELENLVLADLKNMDLKGANILNLSCGTEETNISFEITEANIAFTARSKTDVKATALIHHGQIYTDDATLSKCDGWINYIWSVTHDTIQKHRDKLATSLDHPSQET